jgi:hypothetical protein
VFKKGEKQGHVSHTMALPFTLKGIILRQKKELCKKLKYFTMQKYTQSSKQHPLKETKSSFKISKELYYN